jgi:hypothetical protein
VAETEELITTSELTATFAAAMSCNYDRVASDLSAAGEVCEVALEDRARFLAIWKLRHSLRYLAGWAIISDPAQVNFALL